MTLHSRQSHELTRLRGVLATLKLEAKLIEFRLSLERRYRSEQPRAPAGQPNGGQWIPVNNQSNSSQNYQRFAETCQEYISENCKGRINREFPKQFLDTDVSDLKAAAQANEPGAKKAYKLLFDKRFSK